MKTVDTPSFTSFDGVKRIACGNLETNVLAVKRAIASGSTEPVLIFDDRTGRVQEVDIRGTDAEAIARLAKDPIEASESIDSAQSSLQPRGRGRPKLGVIPREVTLLPRHWDWLSTQPGGPLSPYANSLKRPGATPWTVIISAGRRNVLTSSCRQWRAICPASKKVHEHCSRGTQKNSSNLLPNGLLTFAITQ
ncbi:Uncharacterized protein conserved in bacteria [Serratia grimesii]|nr:Uncharacterized protein conserved in bacteria [Serratia grimesii]